MLLVSLGSTPNLDKARAQGVQKYIINTAQGFELQSQINHCNRRYSHALGAWHFLYMSQFCHSETSYQYLETMRQEAEQKSLYSRA